MSTQQQISDANQQSVELSNNWIRRLREVQSVALDRAGNELPEIVIATVPLVKPSEATVKPSSHLSRSADHHSVDSRSTSELDPSNPDLIQDSLMEKPVPRSLPTPGNRSAHPADQKTLSPAELLELLSKFVDTSQIKIADADQSESEHRHLPIRPLDSSIPKPLLAPASPDSSLVPSNYEHTDSRVQHHRGTKLEIDTSFFQLENRTTALRINRLIDRILEKIPPVNATSITFGDSCNLVNTTFVSIQAAAALVKRDLGPAILIDADPESGFLSRELCSREKTGYLQLLAENIAWQSCVYPTSIVGLDFMPVGQWQAGNPFSSANRNNILRVLSEIKQRYRYVCICGGNLNHNVGLLTAAASDANYLVVDLHSCDQDEVRSIAARLHDVGARTLGCISTEI